MPTNAATRTHSSLSTSQDTGWCSLTDFFESSPYSQREDCVSSRMQLRVNHLKQRLREWDRHQQKASQLQAEILKDLDSLLEVDRHPMTDDEEQVMAERSVVSDSATESFTLLASDYKGANSLEVKSERGTVAVEKPPASRRKPDLCKDIF